MHAVRGLNGNWRQVCIHAQGACIHAVRGLGGIWSEWACFTGRREHRGAQGVLLREEGEGVLHREEGVIHREEGAQGVLHEKEERAQGVLLTGVLYREEGAQGRRSECRHIAGRLEAIMGACASRAPGSNGRVCV